MNELIKTLKEAFETLAGRVRALEEQERSEVTGGVVSVLFVDLPAPGETGRLLFVTDGRKTGEGGGAGTGVLAYDDGVAWRRTSDDTTVAV